MAATERKETCGTCKHGDFPEKSKDLAERIKDESSTGYCRIDPPKSRLVLVPLQTGGLKPQFFSAQPTCREHHWCSKWEPQKSMVN